MSADLKRIAILLPDLRGGGVERVRLLLASEFVERGFDVDIVLMQQRGELLDETPHGCRIVSLEACRLRTALPPLRRYLVDVQPDVLLAGMWPLTGIAAIAVRFLRRRPKLIVSEHNDFRKSVSITRLEQFALRWTGSWLFASADRVVAVSEGVADSLEACLGLRRRDIAVIYNPIRDVVASRAEFPSADEDLISWWRSARVKLIAVGSLKPQKDYPTLLRALRYLITEHNCDARLVVLGEGGSRNSLVSLVTELSLQDHVRFPGFRANPYPYLREADVFVLSSAWEGLGNVITEALACGTPVVATDCPSGPRELLCGGAYGRLAKVGDAVDLANHIHSVSHEVADKDKLKSWAARFNSSSAAEQYLGLMQK